MRSLGSATIVQLMPREVSANGQDIIASAIANRLGIARHFAIAGEYGPVPPETRLVISHNPQDGADAAVLGRLPNSCKVVLHLHYQLGQLTKVQTECLAMSIARADLVVTPAEFLTNGGAQAFPKVPWSTVWNGVDASVFRPVLRLEREDWKREQGIGGSSFVALFVGRLVPAKGLAVLEWLAGHLPADTHLAVQYFDESYGADTGLCLPDRNVTLVPQSRMTVKSLIPYADVLLLPSQSEVAPLVVIEALMSGVPVLATPATPFYDELTSKGIAGEDLIVVGSPVNDEFLRGLAGLRQAGTRDDRSRVVVAECARRAGLSIEDTTRVLYSVYSASTGRA